MKRRRFLQLFGAALTGPALPSVAVQAAPAAYSPASFHAAVYYAQSRTAFSVWGMAQKLGIPASQAEALMTDMAKRGILGPLQGTTFGGRWATSNVMRREVVRATAVVKQAVSKTPALDPKAAGNSIPDIKQLLAHLRDICARDECEKRPQALTS